jgi:hypothetical protein
MTIDYKKFNYVKVGHYTNLMAQIDKLRIETGPVKLCPFMEPLMSKLALMHPEWTIVGIDPRWHINDEFFQVQKFTIYAGHEIVGRINRDGWRDSGEDYKYEILNERVRHTRERSGGMRTKDMKKVLKAIDGFFAPTTNEERRSKACTEMQSHISNTVWKTQRELSDVFSGVTPAMANYIASNLTELRPVLASYGVGESVLDKLATKLEPYNTMQQINAARSSKAGTTVVLVEDRYMLIPDSDPHNPVVVTSQQLDPSMAGKIGILKVFDNTDEALAGVGMRLNSYTFYVLP